MRIVLDATPLIYFTKVGIINLLQKAKFEAIIPPSVYAEVVEKGLKKGKEDALIVQGLVKNKTLRVGHADENSVKKFTTIKKLSRADAETLALTLDRKAVAIIDDSSLRTIAFANNIEFRGTIFLLFSFYRANLIKKNEIRTHLDKMIALGWRCSTEFYSAITKEIEGL